MKDGFKPRSEIALYVCVRGLAYMAAVIVNFYITTVDVVYLVSHVLHYADSGLPGESRKLFHELTILHMLKVVDG
uniref:Uncharacterized protein n=1 Tax=Candidatus Nitrotoga fabula TaxID=2182327 RepID=A0A2X0QSS2_9PROT|nr:conserved protein of unknown function [Candidatus Nitrotoga fabula]